MESKIKIQKEQIEDYAVQKTGDETIDGKKTFLENVTIDRELNTLDHHSYDDSTQLNITTEQGIYGFCSYDTQAEMNNTVPVTHLNGYQSRLRYNGSANMANATGYNVQFAHNGTGVLGNLYGINIQTPIGTGTITNKYGIVIGDFTGGYGIFSGGGNNYFAGKMQHAVGTVNEDSALISDITTGTRAGHFTSLRANNLSPQKLPFHVSDATGLIDSPIATDGAEVFIGGQTAQFKGYDLEIIKSGTQLLMSDNITDSTNKSGRVVGGTYTNANNPLGLLYWTSSNSANIINVGGGSGIITAPTAINLYTAATVGTNTGTQTLGLTNTLITAAVPISGQTATIGAHLARLDQVQGLIENVDFDAATANGNTTNNRVIFTDGTVDLTSLDTTTSPSILTTKPKVLIARSVDPTGLVSEHGFGDNSKWLPTVTDLAYNSYDALVQIEGSTDINHYSGFQTRPTYKNTGEMQLLEGFTSYPRVEDGNVRYSYGFRARGVKTGGNIERNYGLWVDALPSGSIETYAVTTDGSTPSRFGGIVTTGGLNTPANSITLTGSSASYFINGLGTPTLINSTIRNQTLGNLPTGVNIPITSASTILQGFADVQAQINNTVKLTGDQTKAGILTLSSSPIVPTATTSTQAVNLGQVEDLIENITLTSSSLSNNSISLTADTQENYFASTGALVTFTLPPVAGNLNKKLIIVNKGTDTLTMETDASDTDIWHTGTAFNSYPLAVGYRAILFNDGTHWVIIGG